MAIEPPSLDLHVSEMLTQVSRFALNEDEYLKFVLHTKMLCGWADKVPQDISFFFVDWSDTSLLLDRIPGFTKEQLAIASYLQPIHSQLCAIAFQTLWKVDQLIRALCPALNNRNLIAAATVARALIELASAFGVETRRFADLLKNRKGAPAPDVDSLCDFHHESTKLVGQILFGTKLGPKGQPESGIERTNILTLIDKAKDQSEVQWVRRVYDVLCDVVHPSIGSNRCFWTTEPQENQFNLFVFKASRHAAGSLGDLPAAIGRGAAWALLWLAQMWCRFEVTRNDLCLTTKIYALPRLYEGVVAPGDPTGYCSCGRGVRAAECSHEFGVAK